MACILLPIRSQGPPAPIRPPDGAILRVLFQRLQGLKTLVAHGAALLRLVARIVLVTEAQLHVRTELRGGGVPRVALRAFQGGGVVLRCVGVKLVVTSNKVAALRAGMALPQVRFHRLRPAHHLRIAHGAAWRAGRADVRRPEMRPHRGRVAHQHAALRALRVQRCDVLAQSPLTGKHAPTTSEGTEEVVFFVVDHNNRVVVGRLPGGLVAARRLVGTRGQAVGPRRCRATALPHLGLPPRQFEDAFVTLREASLRIHEDDRLAAQ
mmetsp:Transcript_34208/g.86190  ORF Transcript_34208/g.86190 Transcript_34208/m.86190 type:complete len:266 (-) Transcript_34208:430-1227(-)